jgi:predicted dehydrogenase
MNNSPSASFEPVALGIVGLGSFGMMHARTAVGMMESRLVAAVDTREERLRTVSQELPYVPCWNDLGRALVESQAEAWIVASSTQSHVPLAEMVLAAGKPVLLEKPLFLDLAAAESLAPRVRADSSNLMMGHVVLFSSEFRQLLEEVKTRGPLRYIDAVRHRPTTALDTFPDESPFYLTMVHDLYMVLALMDRAEPVRMSAQVRRAVHGGIDLALAQLQWQGGTIASLVASFMTPPGMASDGFDRLEVFGQGWAARLESNPRPFVLWDERARWPMGLDIRAGGSSSTGMLAEQLRCFCRVVRGLDTVPMGATYEDGVRILSWIEQLMGLSR